MNAFRLRFWVFLFCTVLSNTVAYASFTLMGTHPKASLNWHGAGHPCPANSNWLADGRAIRNLEAFDGGIYASYGDWRCNTGPIDLYKMDALSGAFSYEFTQATEAISRFRVFDGNLYSVSIDPSGSTNGDVYAVKSNGSWSKKNQVQITGSTALQLTHPLDINTFGGNLWLFSDYWNGTTQSARATRSDDGGSSWYSVLSLPIVPSDGARGFCFGEEFNNKLYVQEGRFGCGSITETFSRVYDGISWTTGPDLAPTGASTRKTGIFAGLMVMIHGQKLYAFDGVSATLTSDAIVHDYVISGDTLFVLRNGGKVCRTKNLISYNCFDDGSATSLSIAILNDHVYLGTELAKIYRAPIPDWPSIGFLPSVFYLLFGDD
ncbi:MAG TPA: hypothetical protein DCE52_02955 [Rhodobacteraceae bacterium]|nr:hypothetical protein [Paracoccaceae bacterium]